MGPQRKSHARIVSGADLGVSAGRRRRQASPGSGSGWLVWCLTGARNVAGALLRSAAYLAPMGGLAMLTIVSAEGAHDLCTGCSGRAEPGNRRELSAPPDEARAHGGEPSDPPTNAGAAGRHPAHGWEPAMNAGRPAAGQPANALASYLAREFPVAEVVLISCFDATLGEEQPTRRLRRALIEAGFGPGAATHIVRHSQLLCRSSRRGYRLLPFEAGSGADGPAADGLRPVTGPGHMPEDSGDEPQHRQQ